MSRNRGTFNFSANFEGNLRAPIDAKMLVSSYSDLTNPSTWTNTGFEWTYVGMPVSVASGDASAGMYILNASDYTNILNWSKIGTIDVTKTYVDGSLSKKVNKTGDIMSGDLILNSSLYILGNVTTCGSTHSTRFGVGALPTYTTDSYGNTAFGYGTLHNSPATSRANTAIGSGAIYTPTGDYNTAVGSGAGNRVGSYNTAIGLDTLGSILAIGGRNTAFGSGSMYAPSGSDNVTLGYRVLVDFIEAQRNVFVGNSIASLPADWSGTAYDSVAVGFQALYNASNFIGNVAIGYQAGYNEKGSNKLYISNSATSTPLIYGDFTTNTLTINSSLNVLRIMGLLRPINSSDAVNKHYVDASFALNSSINAALGYYLKSASLGTSFVWTNGIIDVSVSGGGVTQSYVDTADTFIRTRYIPDSSLNQSKFKWISGYLEPSIASGTGDVTKAYVDGSLSLKTDFTYSIKQDVSIGLKSDITYVNSSLNTKTDFTYSIKQDISIGNLTSRHNFTESSLGILTSRHNITESSLGNIILLTNAINSSLGNYALISYVDSSLNVKTDFTYSIKQDASLLLKTDFSYDIKQDISIGNLVSRHNITESSLGTLTSRHNITEASLYTNFITNASLGLAINIAANSSLGYISQLSFIMNTSIGTLTSRHNITESSLGILTSRHNITETSLGNIISLSNALNSSINNYALITYVDASLNAKTNFTYDIKQDISISLKSDKTYVDSSLNIKTDFTYDVKQDASINLKSDITYVNASIANFVTNSSVNISLANYIKSTSIGYGLIWDGSLLDVSITASKDPSINSIYTLIGGVDYTSNLFINDNDNHSTSLSNLDQIMGLIAPAKPDLLTTKDLSLGGGTLSTTKYSAKLPSGLASSWYTEASNGTTISNYVIDSVFRLYTPAYSSASAACFRAGLYQDPCTMGTITAVINGLDIANYTIPIIGIGNASINNSDVSGNLVCSSTAGYGGSGNNFWRKAEAYIDVTNQKEGLIKYAIKHTEALTSKETSIYYDNVNSTPTFLVNGSANILSDISIYLSGISHYGTNSTFTTTYTAAAGIFRKAYHPTTVGTLTSTYGATVNSNPASPPNVDASYAVSTTFTFNTASQISGSSLATMVATIYKPTGTTATSTITLPKRVNTYLQNRATTTVEYFTDESRRVKDGSSGTDLIWSSSDYSLFNPGNGSYAQVQNGTLRYPVSADYNSFAFSGVDKMYMRRFTKSAASSGSLTFAGFAPNSQLSPFGSGDINALIWLTDQGLYFDLGRAFGVGGGSGVTMATGISAYSSLTASAINWTLGSYSTGNEVSHLGTYMVIIVFRTTTRSMTQITSA